MSAPSSGTAAVPEAALHVDDNHPWIGLASFTEETRPYFYGREDEVAELARRVQRKLLTVLFGQSGLGKTSILRAGLVPRLRAQGYCPVYVRVDYSRDAPEPAEQIKQAIARTASISGQWTQAGVATAGESLWEFMHHRDDELRDEAGNTLIPLIIFDQFEEVFTIAQSDEFGRARAARFVADLADLVENRAPAAVERKLEEDDSAAERFDFARSDYRVLIALREDYLAQLESLKGAMPSITQNRLRLARMSGTQGLAAVQLPGGRLVSQEVAAAIVRFVAGGAELANAEVEPSLLSLICRELNETRLAQGRPEISLDLLEGSRATILSNFYERALADQPVAARRIIEDELLTDSGYRENIAEERLKRSFALAGVPPETLSTLVNRRLLRIEERLDVRRVELTHDVLCEVVKGSRDIRHEREAREATERLLADQQQREVAARRALQRARRVAAACIVLSIGAVAGAVFSYWSTQRAKRAENISQQSRVQAELLLGYLTDDFTRELETFGRLDLIASLAQREVDYFHALPAVLRGPITVRTGATALTQLARSSRTLGRIDEAKVAVAEARQLLESLREAGDTSPETTIALARAISTHARILSVGDDPEALTLSRRALELGTAVAQAPGASQATREAEVDLLTQYGYQLQNSSSEFDKAIDTLTKARERAAALGARDLTNLYMADRFLDATAWLVQAAAQAGRGELALQAGVDASALADQVLIRRPSDLVALYAQGVILANLGGLAVDEMRPAEASAFSERAVTVQRRLIALDPGNTIAKNNLAVAISTVSDASWGLGQVGKAIELQQLAFDDSEGAMSGGSGIRLNRLRSAAVLASYYAQYGQFERATQLSQFLTSQAVQMRGTEPKDSLVPLWIDGLKAFADGTAALARGELPRALAIVRGPLQELGALGEREGVAGFWKNGISHSLLGLRARAELLLGRYGAGERSARDALAAHLARGTNSNYDRLQADSLSIMVALSLAGQQRDAGARDVIAPVVKARRDAQARNRGDQDTQQELANALYVQALVEPARRTALLQESARLMDGLAPEYRKFYGTRIWRDRLSNAQRGLPLPPAQPGS
ncbi:MAG: hypothetical protein ABW278_11305 [Steroidobacteraceae bacterium]